MVFGELLGTLTGTTYSNAGPLRKRWHLEFSSVGDENSLVSTAFRTERERAQMEYVVPVSVPSNSPNTYNVYYHIFSCINNLYQYILYS